MERTNGRRREDAIHLGLWTEFQSQNLSTCGFPRVRFFFFLSDIKQLTHITVNGAEKRLRLRRGDCKGRCDFVLVQTRNRGGLLSAGIWGRMPGVDWPLPLAFLSFLKKNVYWFLKFILNWRITALQYCVGFCHTTTWIRHKHTCLPPEPLPIPYPIPAL